MEIIGHQKQWQFLKRIAKLGGLPHALLFCGEEKLGKKTIAFEFVKLICGENFFERENPDFILVQPEDKEIQIAQIRELCWRLALKPYSAPTKCAIIDQAHLMNEESQNSLLKTLEEPKGSTLLILIAQSPQLLFPTILSRCEILKFYPVKNSEIEKYLQNQGFSAKDSEETAELSQGKPGAAIDFIREPQKLELRKKNIEKFIKISKNDLFFRFQYAKELSEDSLKRKEVLGIWLFFLRKVLISKLENNETFKEYSISKLKNFIQQIQNTIFLLSTTNVNPKLALEILMLEL